MAEFRGLFPAIVSPMTPEGSLNESAFREVMEFNIQAGVHGFWIAGGTGEFEGLTGSFAGIPSFTKYTAAGDMSLDPIELRLFKETGHG